LKRGITIFCWLIDYINPDNPDVVNPNVCPDFISGYLNLHLTKNPKIRISSLSYQLADPVTSNGFLRERV
jgi:hypothetical protein